MRNQLNELKPCWIHPGTICGLLYNRFYETNAMNGTPLLNIIKTTAKQVWLSVLNIRRTMRPGYASTTRNLQIVLNTPKNPYLNQATPKNTCQIFLSKKKYQNRKFQTQKNPSIIPVT